MPRRSAKWSALAVVLALTAAACGSAEVESSPLPTTSSAPPTSTSPSATDVETPNGSTLTETDPPSEDRPVLAGQFTAFVGAEGQGDPCDAARWWTVKPPAGEPFVSLSDTRTVTVAGRNETLCLFGFDDAVEVWVTGPGGDAELLEVVASREAADVPTVLLAAWQSSPSPSPPSESTGADGTDEPADEPTGTETDTPTTDAFDEPTETPPPGDDQDVPIERAWPVPAEARGNYVVTASQDDREASTTVTVVAPTRLEVGEQIDGTRTVTLHHGPDEPVRLGIYRKVDVSGDFVPGDGFFGRPFELVADAGWISGDDSVTIEVDPLGPGEFCAISRVLEFVDCQDTLVDGLRGAGWSQ